MHAGALQVAGGVLTVAVLLAAGTAGAADATLRGDLEALRRRTVLFGHQSVGNDLLAGLADLAAEAELPLRVTPLVGAGELPAGTLGHALVPENGQPLRKLEAFERLLGPGPAPVEVALLKLCYVDVTEGTDVQALFERYRDTLAALRARHPATTFVRVTVPLTAVPTGPKAFLKRLLGRDRHAPDDARREEFNALVRGAWRGPEPLFDLARIESTWPDGRPETFDVGGWSGPALVPAYTDDGGHLNATGRRRAARELVRILAALPR